MKYKVGDIVFSTIWKKSVLIKDIRPNRFYLIADLEYLSRTMVTYESNLKSREDDIEKDMEEHQKNVDEIMAIQGIEPIEAEIEEVWHCPEDYIFKDENGNVINTQKIVLEKKKKEYPKTYEECCVLLGAVKDRHYFFTKKDKDDYPNEVRILNVLDDLRRLLICRDTYWMIAGEEMGLGKPWKPDYDSGVDKYGIICLDGVVQDSNPTTNWERHLNKVFDFPNKEMRDAFYENFKKEIEMCKELL